MDCDRLRQRLPELIEGCLKQRERLALEQHLGSCPECQAELACLRRVASLFETLCDEPPPAGLWDQVSARLPVAAPRRLPRLALAGALAAGLIGLALLRPPEPEPATPFLRDHYRATSLVALGNPAVSDVMAFVVTEPGQ